MTAESRTAPVFLAFDLGAESGRLMAGRIAEDRLAMEEIHRFRNGPVAAGGRLYWDILRLWEEMQTGLAKAAAAYGKQLAGLGVDAWGVDFGLLDRTGALLGNPFHYRDARTQGMAQAAFRTVPRRELFSVTGIQPMDLNSLYQLLAMADSGVLDAAETFLNIPDLFNHWLCGRTASEWTIASTTQCLDARRREWSRDLLARFGIPAGLFPSVVAPGTVLEQLSAAVAAQAGCGRIPVANVGSHDTASAVAAVPAADSRFIFLSSGTWSLMGVEVDDPILAPRALECGFSNEGGANGKFLFLKNISGLWLLQECRRAWSDAASHWSYDSLIAAARKAAPFACFVAPGDPRFLSPGDMPGRIREYCRATGQTVPQSVGEIVRCILESLALEYRRTADQLSEVFGQTFRTVHVIGGGSRNRLLNRFAANAMQRTVIAGPAEATALGNVIGQAVAVGRLAYWEEGRKLAQRTEPLTVDSPADGDAWEAAYARYSELAKNGREA
jgi:rhamnulokinase